MPHLLLWLS